MGVDHFHDDARSHAQILIRATRVDHLAGIHHVARIPDRLELAERIDQHIAVLLRQKDSARLAVAMLAGNRSAVLHDQVRGAIEEAHPLGDAVDTLEVEVDPEMHASLAEMAIERRPIVELAEQLAEFAQVHAESFGGDGGIFPPFVSLTAPRWMRGNAQCRFANFPELVRLNVVVEECHRRRIGLCGEIRHQLPGLCGRLVLRVAAEFRQQPAASGRE